MAIKYRAPMRPSPYAPPRIAAHPTSIFDDPHGLPALARIITELENTKRSHEAEVAKLIAEARAEITTELDRMRTLKRGEKGDMPVAGLHYRVPTAQEIVEEVMAILPPPKHGKDANEKAIEARVLEAVTSQLPDVPSAEEVASLVLSLIVVPKPQDGTSPDSAALVDEVIRRIAEEKVLKLEHIDGLSTKLQQLKGSGGYVHGGGDTVVAGSNITITKNASGRKVISSTGGSGGGGFTLLAATEIPDGTITVFTFPTASAQPQALIVDNAYMRAVTKKGTINWTWDAGAKQATLTVAAADEIIGVV